MTDCSGITGKIRINFWKSQIYTGKFSNS